MLPSLEGGAWEGLPFSLARLGVVVAALPRAVPI